MEALFGDVLDWVGQNPGWAYTLVFLVGMGESLAVVGAEWLTDVFASLALGVAWISALGLAFRRHSRLDPRWAALGGIAPATLAIGLWLRGWLDEGRDLARYTPYQAVETLTQEQWLAEGWRRLPQYRGDLRRRPSQPLTFQFAGDPPDLARALAAGNWHAAELLRWGNAPRLLSPSLALAELPVIPQRL